MKAHVSAEYAGAGAGPRVPGADEHQERPSGPEAPSRQGPEAADGQQRVAYNRQQPEACLILLRRTAAHVSAEPSGFAAGRDFNGFTNRAPKIHGRFCTLFVLANGRRSAAWDRGDPQVWRGGREKPG